MKPFKSLYFDNKNHRFCLFTDNSQQIYFTHWLELKRKGIRFLSPNTSFQADIEVNNDQTNSRGVKFSSITLTPDNLDSKVNIEAHFNIISNESINQTRLINETTNPSNGYLTIFINCQFDSIEIDDINFYQSLVFIECRLKGNFRLINCKINGDLWMPNCQFEQHFSLKSTIIKGDIHLETSDFTGLGGASFRGIKANNLYLDLGVKGGDDLFWLNEMIISGIVSIGGEFNNEIQLLARQDKEDNVKHLPFIGSLVIGKELYQFEKTNNTRIRSKLLLKGLNINNALHIERLECKELNIEHINASDILIKNVSIDTDLSLLSNQVLPLSQKDNTKSTICKGAILLQANSIGRHLKIDNNEFEALFDLSGSAVSEVTYFEGNRHTGNGKINLSRFTTSRFLIRPHSILLGKAKKYLFKPCEFSIIKSTSEQNLADQYCSLKNWFSDSGQLYLEDIAFFHMRHYSQPSRFKRFIFGGIFGWGVRLSNIAVSSIILILFFSGVYLNTETELEFSRAFSLSTQSFISSFFGKWDDYSPDNLLVSLITIESIIGVLFITVFVGAYIRKLLR